MPNAAKPRPIILGASERDRNPLRKLIAGFCYPFIPKDDEDETIESHEGSPKSNVKARGLLAEGTDRRNITTANYNESNGKERKKSSVSFEKLDINRSLHINTTQKTARNMSEITIESQDSTAADPSHFHNNTPELEMAKSVVRQRRQHALQVFFASIIFVMAAVVILQKLGYSIADFHAPIHSLLPPTSSSSKGQKRLPWIRIFDKTAVETGKIKVQAKATPSDPVTSQKEEKTTADTVNEEGGDSASLVKDVDAQNSNEKLDVAFEDASSANADNSDESATLEGSIQDTQTQEL